LLRLRIDLAGARNAGAFKVWPHRQEVKICGDGLFPRPHSLTSPHTDIQAGRNFFSFFLLETVTMGRQKKKKKKRMLSQVGVLQNWLCSFLPVSLLLMTPVT
jgi:hypothetical protein